MKVVHTANELKLGSRNICLAIGFFDGVHLGHQQIIRQTIADTRQHNALSLVLTFDQHPQTIVAPNRVPLMIYSLPQRIRAIESLGAEALLLIHFDRAFSEQTGEAFIRNLVHDPGHLRSVCVGANFAFGHKRSGNVALLKQLGEELKFAVHGLAAVALDGKVISSTRIREMIRVGDLDAAGQMLGRAYALAGCVVHGDQLGKKIGFPTANLDTSGLVLPPNGVYAVQVLAQGRTHRGVMNIGLRPTLQSPTPQLAVEVHLLDFSGQLYGQEIEVTFIEKLREEKKFASLEKLKAQIEQDIGRARSLY